MHKKFIIWKNKVILGHVSVHQELLPEESWGQKEHGVVGGGWWYFGEPNNTMYLYSTSTGFGSVTQEQINQASFHERDNKGMKVVFDPMVAKFEHLQEKYKIVSHV